MTNIQHELDSLKRQVANKENKGAGALPTALLILLLCIIIWSMNKDLDRRLSKLEDAITKINQTQKP